MFRTVIAIIIALMLSVPVAAQLQYVSRIDGLGRFDAPIAPSGSVLPRPLVISADVYHFNGVSYDMTAQGLYVLFAANSEKVDASYRIVVNVDNPDVESLISALAWITVYGTDDEVLSDTKKTIAARDRKLALACSETSLWAKNRLTEWNVEARLVRLLTGETPNNFTDGHVAIEVKIGGVWRLFDFFVDGFFLDDGERVSLRKIIETGVSTLELEPLARFEAAGSDSAITWNDAVYRFQEAEWRERIFQIPGVVHTDGKTYFYLPKGLEHRQPYVEGLSSAFVVVSKATWDAMFYPD